jgi:hypothetical protein
MKFSIFYSKSYFTQMKTFLKDSNIHLYNFFKKLNKKGHKALHLIWLTMWFNMHTNLCHDFYNESFFFIYAH